ncbi:hypothetical protein AB1Y20_015145 [Prymnesium parvum]|uniref:Uncharacterized protein n=1 Tax=Prymnesium parvum TaxID=97485 RepID=A0AB34JZT2_PRYPA|mmetsp:Transcript_8871/g.19646  ORF Transcript_8871/g.19646 Transcript_8871/m.19646 type:complete len:110 (+) Transcript_8871:32-361(+)
MPNRGPVDFSSDELAALLDSLPPARDPKEAQDDDERQQLKYLASARGRLEETQAADESAGVVIVSIDEVDALIDCLPPPTAGAPIAAVRMKLGELQRSLQENAVTATQG